MNVCSNWPFAQIWWCLLSGYLAMC